MIITRCEILHASKNLIFKFRILKKLEKYPSHYLLIDMPGQLELYTCDDSIRKILAQFEKWKWCLCAVHLNDSTHASDPGKFISVVLSTLAAMVNFSCRGY